MALFRTNGISFLLLFIFGRWYVFMRRSPEQTFCRQFRQTVYPYRQHSPGHASWTPCTPFYGASPPGLYNSMANAFLQAHHNSFLQTRHTTENSRCDFSSCNSHPFLAFQVIERCQFLIPETYIESASEFCGLYREWTWCCAAKLEWILWTRSLSFFISIPQQQWTLFLVSGLFLAFFLWSIHCFFLLLLVDGTS